MFCKRSYDTISDFQGQMLEDQFIEVAIFMMMVMMMMMMVMIPRTDVRGPISRVEVAILPLLLIAPTLCCCCWCWLCCMQNHFPTNVPRLSNICFPKSSPSANRWLMYGGCLKIYGIL